MGDFSKVLQTLLGLTVFSIPFAGYHLSSDVVSLSITNLLIVLATTLLAVSLAVDERIEMTKQQLLVLAAFTSILLIGAAVSLIHDGAVRRFVTITGQLLLLALISVGVKTTAQLRRLIHLVFISSLVVCSLAVIASVVGVALGGSFHQPRSILTFSIPFTRTAGIPLSHGEFGMFTLATVPLYLMYGIRDRNLSYLAGVGFIQFTVIFILQSRSGWLALFAGLTVTLFVVQPRSQDSPIAGYVSKIRMAALSVSPFAGIALVWVIVDIGQSIDLRARQLLTSLELIVAQPLGYGWGNIRPFFERDAFPHNAFLRNGVESGVLVLILLIFIFIVVARDLYRIAIARDGDNQLLAAGLLAGLAAVFVEANNLIGFGKAGWLWIAFGLAFYRTCARSGSETEDLD